MQAKPAPEIRYEPLPPLPTGKYPGQEKERRGVIAWFFRAMGCVLNAAVVAAIVLRTSPASVVPPCGRTIRPVSACPNCLLLLLLLSLRSNSVVVLHVDFGLSNAPPCA